VRDFAEAAGDGKIDAKIADNALTRLEVDALGLDAQDRRYLFALTEKFAGGPVGLETLAASMSEARDSLEEVIEPFLIQQGFLQRTPRGRVATKRAFGHLGLAINPDLFAGGEK
jgi:Holliday junction DNA helicase RuvB